MTSDDEIIKAMHEDWQRDEPPHPDVLGVLPEAQRRLAVLRYSQKLITCVAVIIVLTPLIIVVEWIWWDDWRTWVTTLIIGAGAAFILSLIAGELKKRGGGL